MNRAFTLVEILVVGVAVAVIAAVAVPFYSSSVSRARATKCLSHLHHLGVALNLYLAEHEMKMPPLAAARASLAEEVPVIDSVLRPYTDRADTFLCPADATVGRKTGTSYYWNSALSGQPVHNLTFLWLNDLGKIPVIVDKEGWHTHARDKVNHLFADGHSANQLRMFAE